MNIKLIIFIINDNKNKMVEHIGPPYYKILTYEETCDLTWPRNHERSIELNTIENNNEKSVIPLDIHKAVIDKLRIDDNLYATSKSNSQNFLNMAVVQTQILQLVNIAQYSTIRSWESVLISLLCISLSLQFVIFILLVLLAKSKTEQVTKYCLATNMNSLVTSLTVLLLIITTAITAVSKVAGPSFVNVTVN